MNENQDNTDDNNIVEREKKEYINEFLHKPFEKPKIGVIIHSPHKAKPDFPVKRKDLEKLLGNDGLIMETFSDKDVYHALAEFRYHKAPIVGYIGENKTSTSILSSMIKLHGEKHMPIFVPLKTHNHYISSVDLDMDKDIGVILNRIKKHYIEKGLLYQKDKPKYVLRNTIKVIIKEVERSTTESETTVKVMKIKAEEEKAPIDEYYGFLFGTGVIYKIIKLIYEGDPKVAGTVKSFLKTYFSLLMNSDLADHLLSKDLCKIKINDEKINMPHTLFNLASPLNKLIENYQPFSNTKVEESMKNQTFNFLSADLNRGDLLKGLPFFIKGRYGNLEKKGKVISRRVEDVEILTNSGLLLDGNLIKPYVQKKSYLINIKSGPIIKFPII
ncbi:MAG: hypothetical protein ACOCV8_03195 [Spirochaetota bacterium]